MALVERLVRVWRGLRPRMVTMPSKVLADEASPRIADGLDYAQPVILPEWKRQELTEAGRLQEWWQQATRDTYRFPMDDPAYRLTDPAFTPVWIDPLREPNWATRLRILSTTHSVYARNPIVKRALFYMMAFVVGEGFTLTCQNPDVEAVLQAFIDHPDNAIREYERSAPIDLLVDGELFLRFFEEDGEVVFAPIRPWEVQYIHTEPQFFKRPLAYHVQPYSSYNPDDPQGQQPALPYDVPAAGMQHVAINRHSYDLRGMSEVYAALPWLRAHKDWLENRARQNFWRGSLIWWVKIATAVPGLIAQKLAQYSRPPTPGSTLVTSDKEEWSALTNPVGAGDAGEDGRQLKLMALNALGGIPEYMTGDGENANLATTKTQQLPVLMTFRLFQTILIEQLWYPMFKRVLQAAIDNGDLPEVVDALDSTGEPIPDDGKGEPEDTGDGAKEAAPPRSFIPPAEVVKANQPKTPAKTKRVKTLDAFSVEYEPLSNNEPFTLAQAIDIAVAGGWLSKQSAATEMGYDWPTEKERLQQEAQESLDAIAQGLQPMPPDMLAQQQADTENQNAQADTQAQQNANANGKQPNPQAR